MRIPVLFGDIPPPDAGDAWLLEADATAPPQAYAVRLTLPAQKFGHVGACHCCNPRGPAAEALAKLFRARATGVAPFFKRVRVVASSATEAALREALDQDVVTKARYVLEGSAQISR